ncbi:MAG: hypothetical protein K2L67_03290 [Clostridia bacterium]|nr:hypothetical protein [Clostridia bacterium]
MNDFKNFSGGNGAQNGGQRQNGAGDGNEGENKKPADVNNTVELAKILTRSMSGKSEAQILHTIIAEAERGKREGTLTNADLDNFYAALAPMLDGIKRRKLGEVISRLKRI